MLTREETQQFKGAAILIMVFLHLFNQKNNVALCEVNLFFLAEPLVLQLSKFCGICVGLYLFLSGYGLYLSYQKSPNVSPWRRILKLYLNFWIVFAIFITLGSFIKPDQYPGNFWELLNNFSGWHTTYNGEWWFLFPYILLVLTASFICRVVKRTSIVPLLILTWGGVYFGLFNNMVQ